MSALATSSHLEDRVRELNAVLPFDIKDREELLEGRFSEVAILFTDIVGFTKLLNRDDVTPEKVLDTLANILGPQVEFATQHGGNCLAYEGDGLLFSIDLEESSGIVLQGFNAIQDANPIKTAGGEIFLDIDAAVTEPGEVYQVIVGTKRRTLITVGKLVQEVYAEEKRTPAGQFSVPASVSESLLEIYSVGSGERGTIPLETLPSMQVIRFPSYEPVIPEKDLYSFVLSFFRGGAERTTTEYRNVTSLFVDLPLIEMLVSGVNKDNYYEMHQLHERLTILYDNFISIVEEKYGGFVDKFKPFNTLVHFGSHRTHGDDQERALRAAFEIKDVYCELATEWGFESELPMGIETGNVCVGMMGEQAQVIGDSVNVAARMKSQSVNNGNLVFIGPELYERIQFDVQGEFIPVTEEIKGKGYFTFYGVRGVLNPQRKHSLDLVGRDESLDLLYQQVEHLDSERAKFLGIEGQAGIGKSRLEIALEKELHLAGWTTYRGKSTLNSRSIPFEPFIAILQGILGIQHLDDKELVRGKIDDFYGPEKDLAIVVRSCLGFGAGELVVMDANKRQSLIREGITYAIRNTPQKTAFFIEDVYLSDFETKELLNQLRDEDLAGKVFVMSYRPHIDHFNGRDFVDNQISLNKLNFEDTFVLVEDLLARRDLFLTPGEIAYLTEMAQGNPYFAQLVVRNIPVVNGAIVGRVTDIAAPEKIDDAILSEVENLLYSEREALYDLAVLGEKVDLRVAQDVLGEIKFSQIEGLKDRGIVSSSIVSRGTSIDFQHSLFHQAVYKRVSESRRREINESAALAYEQLHFKGEDVLPLMARYFRGSDLTKSSYQGNMALRKAVDYTLEHLKGFLNKSRDINVVVAEMGDIVTSMNILERDHQNDAHFVKAKVYRSLAEMLSARNATLFHQNCDLAIQEVERIQLNVALQPEYRETYGFEYVAVLALKTLSLIKQKRYYEAREKAEEAEYFSEVIENDYLLARVLHRHAEAIMNLDPLDVPFSYDDPLEKLIRAKDLLESKTNLRDEGKDDLGRIYYQIGVFHKNSKGYELAVSSYRQALDLFDSLNDKVNMAATHNSWADLYLGRNDDIKADEHATEALEIAIQYGARKEEALALINQGEATQLRADRLADKVQYQRVLDKYREALPIFEEIGEVEFLNHVKDKMIPDIEKKLRNKD